MKRLLITAAFALLTLNALALPTVGDVQAQVRDGHYAEAQSQMREVVEAKPGSAKAHYIYAEILAHNGRFVDAAAEAKKARELDPTLKFADADKFRSFEQTLQREVQKPDPGLRDLATTRIAPTAGAAPTIAPVVAPVPSSSGLPVGVWVLGLGVVGFLAWRLTRSAATTPSPAGTMMSAGAPAGYAPGATGYGPNYGASPAMGYGPAAAPRPGGGMMGVGLAAAGGVAAGMLAERLLERGHEGGATERSAGAFERDSFAGGAPVVDNDARALESRDVDFGTGAGWDSNDAGSDAGGGSDSDSW